MTKQSLVPVVQKEVIFYEDVITAVRANDGNIYVPIRPICDLLGVDAAAQRRRVQRDPVLSAEARPCDVVTASQGQPDQRRLMLCLPLDFISGFLFGISAQRVKPEIKDRLIRYQKECYKVLAEAFQEGRLTSEPSFDDLLANDTPAAQAYKMASAIMQMARQQLILEAQLETHAMQLTDHESRLEEIEATLGDPGQHVTPDQAMQISQAVKTVAIALGKKTKRNEFGAVYGELYRQFGVTSYKLVPANRFEQAMKFLSQWHQDVEGDTPF
jgi:hypothetical protein